MKQPGDAVVLRRVFWDGPEPAPGDELRTKRGRRYLIREVHGARLDCVIVPAEAELRGRVFWWRWGSRR